MRHACSSFVSNVLYLVTSKSSDAAFAKQSNAKLSIFSPRPLLALISKIVFDCHPSYKAAEAGHFGSFIISFSFVVVVVVLFFFFFFFFASASEVELELELDELPSSPSGSDGGLLFFFFFFSFFFLPSAFFGGGGGLFSPSLLLLLLLLGGGDPPPADTYTLA